LIHFKCCPEEKWYPCHKCQNAAVAGTDPNDKTQENDRPPDPTVSNNTALEISSEAEADVSNENEGIPQNLLKLIYTIINSEEALSK